MPNPAASLNAVHKLLLRAELEYTPAAYARALAALEELPDQEDPEVRFRRAAVQHALAELRGDAAMLRAAVAEYERLHAARALPAIARLLPELIAECHEQLREAQGGAAQPGRAG